MKLWNFKYKLAKQSEKLIFSCMRFPCFFPFEGLNLVTDSKKETNYYFEWIHVTHFLPKLIFPGVTLLHEKHLTISSISTSKQNTQFHMEFIIIIFQTTVFHKFYLKTNSRVFCINRFTSRWNLGPSSIEKCTWHRKASAKNSISWTSSCIVKWIY